MSNTSINLLPNRQSEQLWSMSNKFSKISSNMSSNKTRHAWSSHSGDAHINTPQSLSAKTSSNMSSNKTRHGRCYPSDKTQIGASLNLSTKTSPNIDVEIFTCSFNKGKNKYRNKGIYSLLRKDAATVCINPQPVWRETCARLGCGNELVHDPKSQQTRITSALREPNARTRRGFRSTIAISRRKANRKEHRAVKRHLYRQLGKCHPVKAMQGETYVVAQDCHSTADTLHDKNPLSRSLKPEKTESKLKLFNIKIATLNLDGGITHVSGRQKVVHTMVTNRIDVLALQETRVNSDTMEQHGDCCFYFSTGVTYERKKEAEQIRQQQRNMEEPSLSEIEMYNLDAEKQGVAIVYHKKLEKYKCNVTQVNGRILMITFDASPLRTNIVAAYAPHAGRSLVDKDNFYNELGKVLDNIPKHETNISLGDFNARLMERLPHETETLGEHLFREDESRIEQLSLAQQDNRTRFISFRQEHDLTVVNTLFQKDKSDHLQKCSSP